MSSAAGMTILCVDQYGELGGAQKMLLDLLPAFAQRGWKIHVALPDGPMAVEMRRGGFTTHPIETGRYTKIRKPPIEMLKYALASRALAGRLGRIVRDN